MSHYGLLVVTDFKPDKRDLEKIMAPFYETEGNENSKWDWYQIGGRWSGALDPDYDPEKDERNIERCDLCHGTGMRNDQLGRERRVKDPDFTCNGCDGKGKHVKWPTEWANDIGNQLQVKDLKPNTSLEFFAYLRNGEWIEKGDMGWWGIVLNEKDEADWEAQTKAIIASLKPDDWLTAVDVHI